jgi:hypothetical protein
MTTKGVNAPQASRSPDFEDQQLFFTSSGCIGLVTEVDQTLAKQMEALDHELANLVEGKHGRSHTMWAFGSVQCNLLCALNLELQVSCTKTFQRHKQSCFWIFGR